MISRHQQIYNVIQRIPAGCVATYGQIARLAGFPNHARQVGYALASLPDGIQLPWHRVVNAQGRISRGTSPGQDEWQRLWLEQEGIVFNDKGGISLKHYQWQAFGNDEACPQPLSPTLPGATTGHRR